MNPKHIESFRRIVGDRLSTDPQDLAHYGKDWSGVLEPKPSLVVFPKTADEVARILIHCQANLIAVVPSGGRTGLSGGAVAANGELVLSLEKMNQMGPVDGLSMTVRVGAGAVTETVHKHCEAEGVTWPVDFASKGSSQVGGNLSTNAGGVRVIRYGNTRNWVLSIEFVTLKGEILELNGELEKNASGLDLRHLVIGSEGTLGVITAATLRLCKVSEHPKVFLFAVRDESAATALLKTARAAPFEIRAFEYMSLECFNESLSFLGKPSPFSQEQTEAKAYVLMEVEGGASDAILDQWLEARFESGAILDGVKANTSKDSSLFWSIREGVAESILMGGGESREVHQHDVSVPIHALSKFTNEVSAMYSRLYPELEVFIFGHLGDGNLHIFIRNPWRNPKQAALPKPEFLKRCKKSDQNLFEFVQSFKGSVSAEHGIGLLKQGALSFTRSETEIAYLRAIKKVFDPDGLLNPGKTYGV